MTADSTPTDQTNHSLTIPGLPFPSTRNLGKAVLGAILWGILYFVPEVASALMRVPAFMLGDSQAADALLVGASLFGGDAVGFIWPIALTAGLIYWLADFETLRDGMTSQMIPVTAGFVGVMYGAKLLVNLPDIIGFVARGFTPPEYTYGTGETYIIQQFYFPAFLVYATVVSLAVVVVLTGQVQRDRDYLDMLLQIGLIGFVLGGLKNIPRRISDTVRYQAQTGTIPTGRIIERLFESAISSGFQAVAIAVTVFAAFLLTKHLYDSTSKKNEKQVQRGELDGL